MILTLSSAHQCDVGCYHKSTERNKEERRKERKKEREKDITPADILNYNAATLQ